MERERDVLIVEDEPSTRLLLSAIVELFGFHPTLATDGAAALRQLTSGKCFDVVVLDLLLPNTNGFEVLRHLRCTNPDALKRVIVVTAASSITTKDCQELSEVWQFMHKPLDVEELALQVMACAAEHAGARRTSASERQPPVRGNDATA